MDYYKLDYAPEDEPYINIIYKFAHEHATNARVDFEDYVIVGLAALHKAREFYDKKVGVKFITYAYRIIEMAIKKEWQENANILSCSAYHAKNTKNAANEIRFQNATTISLDTPGGKQSSNSNDKPRASGTVDIHKQFKKSNTFASGSADPQAAAQKNEIIQKVDAIIEEFNGEDRDIIYRRVFAGETFQHIATSKKMSWRAVNYRFKKLEHRLKTKFTKAGLKEYASENRSN